MSERRFTDKAALNPGAVWGLPDQHPAMRENRTLFPSTVVEVTASEPRRLLVSGKENRKLGATVEKGRFKDWALYSLSLEERATCPTHCDARAFCYGNGMQLARRHRIGDPEVLYDRIAFELQGLLDDHKGVLVRLHVLGDFPDTDYVAFWKDVLDENPNVACFGYTHWRDDDPVGKAIASVKAAHAARFRIRWSRRAKGIEQGDTAVISDRVPPGRETRDGLVCPAQTDATACCATCGLCWEANFRQRGIVFIKHGPTSDRDAAETALAQARGASVDGADQQSADGAAEQDTTAAPEKRDDPDEDDAEIGDGMVVLENVRTIAPLDLGGVDPKPVEEEPPNIVLIDPTELLVEENYQRELSGRSIALIRQIISGWDWARYKPPILAETEHAYFVIDGQHTAIAAASHPHIAEIPCMVVRRDAAKERAAAFVSQNTARIAVTPYDLYHAEFEAEIGGAAAFQAAIEAFEYEVPRKAPGQNRRPYTIEGVNAARRMFKDDPERFDALMRIAAEAGGVAVTAHLCNVWNALNTSAVWQPLDRERIAARLAIIENFDQDSREYANLGDMQRTRAGCILLTREPSE